MVTNSIFTEPRITLTKFRVLFDFWNSEKEGCEHVCFLVCFRQLFEVAIQARVGGKIIARQRFLHIFIEHYANTKFVKFRFIFDKLYIYTIDLKIRNWYKLACTK
jgi:hypothetical protein